ncbi:MAG: SGNH/GDSL hydrolase family protein [Candidatus Bathyarchaeota archaeon]|nr:SGNH/GDSL hydrolase family protein [Candidatus Bathyarchaeota archaeon]
MVEVLCYGDSNTWGYNPLTKERYEKDERWTGVLQKTLGSDCHIIEEGLNGRTTVWDDPIEGYKNGKTYLIPCLETHKPLDLVIIMLGTNDMKKRFSLSAYDIAQGAGALVDVVDKSNCGRMEKPPRVLLLAPPPLGKLTEFAEMFEGGTEKSKRLSQHYKNAALEYGCEFFDTSTVIRSSDVDGVHLEKEDHKALGKAVAEIVKRILDL